MRDILQSSQFILHQILIDRILSQLLLANLFKSTLHLHILMRSKRYLAEGTLS